MGPALVLDRVTTEGREGRRGLFGRKGRRGRKREEEGGRVDEGDGNGKGGKCVVM